MTRRALSNPEREQQQTGTISTAGGFSARISSPLARSTQRGGGSSPLSSGTSVDKFQLVPSSPPTGRSMLPLSDLPESEPEVRLCDEEMMMMMDEVPAGSSPRIGRFNAAPSSSPGPSWLPALAPNPHDRPTHHRARAWKQPASARPSPRSSSSASQTPLSSPTPLSRAYSSSKPHSPHSSSPSQLRLQAAARLRALERMNRSNAHRPLLDAFSAGSHRGIDDIISSKEEMMSEAIGRRHIKQMNRQWEALLSSQAYATDEMIEEAEESESMDEEPPEHEGEPDETQMYAEEDMVSEGGMESEGGDTSMASTCSTVRPDEASPSLLALLLAPAAVCPACSGAGLQASESAPLHGVLCIHCPWALDGNTLASIDRHFLLHGDRLAHRPLIGYNPHVGTNFICSNPQCDEMVCV